MSARFMIFAIIFAQANVAAAEPAPTHIVVPLLLAEAPTFSLQLPRVVTDLRVTRAQRQYEQGLLLLDQGLHREAIVALMRAHQIVAEPEILFAIARCYMRLDKRELALAVHRRYVRSFRDPVERLVAAARFGSLLKEVQPAPRLAARTSLEQAN
jgi:hypothetical protein